MSDTITPGVTTFSFKGNDLLVRNLQSPADRHVVEHFHALWDRQAGGYRCRPIDFWDIKSAVEASGMPTHVTFSMEFALAVKLTPSLQLRPYQQQAFDSWEQAHHRGIVILPTGAGKTILGLWAIAHVNMRTLVIVPTLELMEQWYRQCLGVFIISVETPSTSEKPAQMQTIPSIPSLVGRFGGGYKDIAPITITTYSSSYLYLPQFRDYFGFLIFDEVHHLAGEKFQTISGGSIAPARLGLTATLGESEDIYALLKSLVGPIIFNASREALTEGGSLAPFVHETIRVELAGERVSQYQDAKQVYSAYLQQFPHSRHVFQRMIFRANQDRDARQALDAYHRARNLAFNPDEKLSALGHLLVQHPMDRILIFSESIDFVERISREFLLPAITSRTPSEERNQIMQKFRDGRYRIIASGKVLDEGVDVPEAGVGIIISGTGTPRQFVQRLGRLLRPQPGKVAKLYEIVTSNTTETRISARRNR